MFTLYSYSIVIGDDNYHTELKAFRLKSAKEPDYAPFRLLSHSPYFLTS